MFSVVFLYRWGSIIYSNENIDSFHLFIIVLLDQSGEHYKMCLNRRHWTVATKNHWSCGTCTRHYDNVHV